MVYSFIVYLERMQDKLGQSQVVLRQKTWSGQGRGGEAGWDKSVSFTREKSSSGRQRDLDGFI